MADRSYLAGMIPPPTPGATVGSVADPRLDFGLLGSGYEDRLAFKRDLAGRIDDLLGQALGPTGIPERINSASRLFNPISQGADAGGATITAFDDTQSPEVRRQAAIDAVAGTLGAAAPAIAGKFINRGTANALWDTLVGIGNPLDTVTGQALADTARGTASDLQYAGRSALQGDLAGVAEAFTPSRAPRGIGADVPNAPQGILAYHGSPYNFEAFDYSKMGTGEGAQAYGRGGYFASEADVARGYRPAGDLMVGNKSVSDLYDSISSRADRLSPRAAEAEYNKMAVLEDLMNDGDVLAVRERAAGGAYDQATMDWFERDIAPNFKGSGSLYEVNIRANPEDFLDWEKPLSEQPEAVLQALDPFIQERLASIAAAGERGRQIAREKGLPDFTPKSLEQIFSQMRGGDIAASGRLGQSSFSEDALIEAGVPGIKYLDPQAGSQNYVVFDPSIIDIVKRYGIAGAATMLGMSQLDLENAMRGQQQPVGLLGSQM